MFILSLFRTAWLSALLLLLLPNAHAQSVLLDLEQALQAAKTRSRQLVAQDPPASPARDMAQPAGQLPDPMLKAGIINLPINGPDRFSLTQDFMTARNIGFSQEFTRAGKRQARAARYEREAEAAEAGRQLALANLRRDTALAWLERHHQERLRDVLRAQRAEAVLQIEAAEAAYRGGRGAQADVFAARTAVAQIDDRILQADRDIATAKTRGARWTAAEAPARQLAARPDLSLLGQIDADNLHTHVAHHPQLALLARQEDVARAEADIARSNKQADWSAELMYSQRGPDYSNMISINFSVPLQIDQASRQDRELTAKLAQAEQARAERDEAQRGHLADARAWLQTWQGNRERLANYDRALIPLAAERTRAAFAAYRGGAGSLAAVLDARRMEIGTHAERVRLGLETAALWARLEYLIPPGQMATAALEQP